MHSVAGLFDLVNSSSNSSKVTTESIVFVRKLNLHSPGSGPDLGVAVDLPTNLTYQSDQLLLAAS